MIFELVGAILESLGDFLGELFEGGGELLEGGAALASELGTAVVAIGAGAAALGALIAVAELSAQAIRNFLYSQDMASKIQNVLNNDPTTLKNLGVSLQNAPQYSISQMKKVVQKVSRTSDGQTVATVRVIHPTSGVYVDCPIAGNTNKDVYEGLVL